MATIKYRPIPELSKQDIARFWSKVDKAPGQGPNGDCWGWTASKRSAGYGQFSIGKMVFGAHRVSMFISSNTQPMDLETCHSCDNPPCCNPEHLFNGTRLDNVTDCISKNRHCHGEGHHVKGKLMDGFHLSKLSSAIASEIFSLYSDGMSPSDLAVKYGVLPVTIHRVLTGKSWGGIANEKFASIQPRGERSRQSSLKDDDVREIRRMQASGELGCRKLSKLFGVSRHCIQMIVRRCTWAHLY